MKSSWLGILAVATLLSGCVSDSNESKGSVEIKPGVYEAVDSLEGVLQYQVKYASWYQGHNPDRVGRGVRRTLLQVREDGTYMQEEFFTSQDSVVVDFRFREEQGSAGYEKSYLHQSQVSERKFEPLVRSLAGWKSTGDQRLTLRAIDSNGFESLEYSGTVWRVWHRISAPDLQLDLTSAIVFVDPQAAYSLRFIPDWNSQLEKEINNIPYDFSSTEAIPGGRDAVANLSALTSARTSVGETLEQRMDAEIKAVGDWFGGTVTVLSRKTTLRGGRTVAEVILRANSNYGSFPEVYREKLVLFKGPADDFTLIRYLDLDSLYDGNAAFSAIDSSLTFF